MKDIVKYEDFEKIEILVGTILEVKINEKARKPAYVLKIDFGEKVGIKQSSAQITNYSIEELLQKQIIAVCNFEKKNIKDFAIFIGANEEIAEKKLHDFLKNIRKFRNS